MGIIGYHWIPTVFRTLAGSWKCAGMTAKDVDDTSFRDHVVASCQPSNFDDHLSSCPRAFVPCCREWTRGKTKVESEKGREREKDVNRRRRTDRFEGAKEREWERDGNQRREVWRWLSGVESCARQGNPLDHSLGTLRNPGSRRIPIHMYVNVWRVHVPPIRWNNVGKTV